MILRFNAECIDKYTSAKYHAGDRIEFPEKRAEEILATGYAIEIKEEKTDEVKEDIKEVKTTKKPTRTRKKATK